MSELEFEAPQTTERKEKAASLGLILICGDGEPNLVSSALWKKTDLFVTPRRVRVKERRWQAVFTGCGCIYHVYYNHILRQNYIFCVRLRS